MANRKRLKKSIKIVTGELFADCVALAHIGQGDSEKLQGLMVEVLALHSDFVARLSHVEKGEENGRTLTKVVSLDRAARRSEIARLSGGDHPSETMIAGAEELLCAAEQYKNQLL